MKEWSESGVNKKKRASLNKKERKKERKKAQLRNSVERKTEKWNERKRKEERNGWVINRKNTRDQTW